jgi:hypothetical protein
MMFERDMGSARRGGVLKMLASGKKFVQGNLRLLELDEQVMNTQAHLYYNLGTRSGTTATLGYFRGGWETLPRQVG